VGYTPLRQRIYETSDLHFIFFSSYHREPNLKPSRLKDLFLSVLERVRQRYRFGLSGYVVMPEHVHLLSGKPERSDLSVVIQVLRRVVSRDASEGHFLQRRFYDFNLQPRLSVQKNFATCIAFGHPGLVEKPEDGRAVE